MRVDQFLSRLDRCRSTGKNRWMACCPAHDDRTPSLSIAEGEGGRILLRCFGGCGVESIVAAVGMTLSDIMPDSPVPANAAQRVRIPAADVLEAMAFNASVVAICAADMARGRQLTSEEKDKLFAIAGELQDAIDATRR